MQKKNKNKSSPYLWREAANIGKQSCAVYDIVLLTASTPQASSLHWFRGRSNILIRTSSPADDIIIIVSYRSGGAYTYVRIDNGGCSGGGGGSDDDDDGGGDDGDGDDDIASDTSTSPMIISFSGISKCNIILRS